MNRHPLRRALVAAAVLSLPPLAATAQQAPITGRMMQGAPAPSAAPAPAPAAGDRTAPVEPAVPALPPAADAPDALSPVVPADEESRDALGAVTRQLLRLQVDGTRAGGRLPVLGDEASASYRRYLQSFEHPIPEFYETAVGKANAGGR